MNNILAFEAIDKAMILLMLVVANFLDIGISKVFGCFGTWIFGCMLLPFMTKIGTEIFL